MIMDYLNLLKVLVQHLRAIFKYIQYYFMSALEYKFFKNFQSFIDISDLFC